MSKITVTKEVTFDCAHMLSGHEALCKNLHGHTYKVLVTVGGAQIESGSSKDMVLDFKHLKLAIDSCIKEEFDHAIIFSARDYRNEAEQELLEWAQKHGMRYYVMPRRTTAEDMALHFQQQIADCLANELGITNITSVSIKVYETPTSYAEVK